MFLDPSHLKYRAQVDCWFFIGIIIGLVIGFVRWPNMIVLSQLHESNSEIDVKMDLDEVVYYEDNGQQFQVSKGVSSKETLVSDGNDTDSSFDITGSENKKRINL